MLRLNPNLKGLGVTIPGGTCSKASLLSVLVEFLPFAVPEIYRLLQRNLQITLCKHLYYIIISNQNTFKPYQLHSSYMDVKCLCSNFGIFFSQKTVNHVHANRNSGSHTMNSFTPQKALKTKHVFMLK